MAPKVPLSGILTRVSFTLIPVSASVSAPRLFMRQTFFLSTYYVRVTFLDTEGVQGIKRQNPPLACSWS